MIKRIVVAGSRDYSNYQDAKNFIDLCISRIKEEYTLIFVSGACKGADVLGERYAIENGFKLEKHIADWQKYGRAAGPKRNKQMALLADYVICFWDGKSEGTKSMIKYTLQFHKPIRIKYIKQKSDNLVFTF